MIRSTFLTKNKGFIEKKPIYVKNSMYQIQKLQAKTKQPSADDLESVLKSFAIFPGKSF